MTLRPKSARMPALFMSDFGPMPAVQESDYTQAIGQLGQTLPRPQSIVIMSGHWEAAGSLGITSHAQPETIHDYYGFPDEFYQRRYPCPGSPALANLIKKCLEQAGLAAHIDPRRGLDHGA